MGSTVQAAGQEFLPFDLGKSSQSIFKMYEDTLIFFCHLTMGINYFDFLFATLDKRAINNGAILKGKNLLLGANSFFQELSTNEGMQN